MIAGLTPSPEEEEEKTLNNPGPSYSGHIVEECVVPNFDIPLSIEDNRSILEKSITESMTTTCYQTCRSSSHCNDFFQDLSSSNSTLRSMSCTDINDGDDEEEAQASSDESSASSIVHSTNFMSSDSPDCSSGFKQRPQSPLKSFNNETSISYDCSLPSDKNSSNEIINRLNPVSPFVPKNTLEINSCKAVNENGNHEKRQDGSNHDTSLDLVPQINSVEGNTQVINPSNNSNCNNSSTSVVIEINNFTLVDGMECLNIVEDNSTKDSEIFCCDFFKKIETSEHSHNHLDLDLVRPSGMPCVKDDSGTSLPSSNLTTNTDEIAISNVVKSFSDSKISNKSSSKCKNKNTKNCFPL